MISNLNEINRVLLSVKALTGRSARIRQRILMEHLNGEVVLGRNPEFEAILDYVERMQLISKNKRGFGLTSLGAEVLAPNISEMYELQPKQRRLLVRKCYLDGAFRSETKRFVKKMSVEPSKGRIMWSSIDSEPLEDLEWLRDHLIQLGVLSEASGLLFVSAYYKSTVSQFMDESADFTEEQFERFLKDKLLSGALAEAFALDFEKERLSASGHRIESVCVQKISGLRVNAGYDINSFDGRSRNLAHDRFIEVKGSGKVTVSFIWTPNEMRKAEELGDRYWIYFIGGVDRKKGRVTRDPVMIQNPHVNLRADARFQISEHNVIVEANLSGPMLSPPTQVSLKGS